MSSAHGIEDSRGKRTVIDGSDSLKSSLNSLFNDVDFSTEGKARPSFV